MGALASSGELGDDDLVDQRDAGLNFFSGEAEDLSRGIDGAGGLALVIGDVQVTFAMIYQAPFTAERTRTMLPFGPGMAPLIASTPFSTSDETMVRFSAVLVT